MSLVDYVLSVVSERQWKMEHVQEFWTVTFTTIKNVKNVLRVLYWKIMFVIGLAEDVKNLTLRVAVAKYANLVSL
jgi:hypothetical protein